MSRAAKPSPPPKLVRLVRTLPYAPERVWDAIANRQQLAAWMGDNDFAPRVGHAFELHLGRHPGSDGVLRCEVLELDPPRRLAFSCASGVAHRGTVTISLAKVAEGTRLVLEHEGLGDHGRELFAFLLPPAWGASAVRAPSPAAIGRALGVAAVVACVAIGVIKPGNVCPARCDHAPDPAPPPQDNPQPMRLASTR